MHAPSDETRSPAAGAPERMGAILSKPGSLVLWLVLTGAACLGNFLALPLLFGVNFLFGSIFTLITLALFGLRFALATALVAGSVTIFLWDHPYGIFIHALEIFAIGLIYRKRTPNLIVCSSVFWFILGIPFVAILSVTAMGAEWNAAWMLSAKQAVNGVFNAIIASALLISIPFARWTGHTIDPFHRSLSQGVYTLICILILSPALLLAVVAGRGTINSIESKVDYLLATKAVSFQSQFATWKEQRLQAVGRLARSLMEDGLGEGNDRAHLHTSSIRSYFPDFVSVAVTDEYGVIREVFPNGNENDFAPGWDSSFLPHFKQIQEHSTPFFTFHNGESDSSYQYIAAPILHNDSFAGAVLCQLHMDQLREVFRRSNEVDGLHSFIKSGESYFLGPKSDYDWREAIARPRTPPILRRDAELFLLAPNSGSSPRFRQWADSFYAMEFDLGDGTGSELLMTISAAPFQDELYAAYSRNLMLVMLLIAFSLLVSMIACKRLANPVARLAVMTADLPERVRRGDLDLRTEEPFPEFNRLLTNFQSAAAALQESFGLLAQKDRLLEDRRQSETEARSSLHESRQELRTILENAPDLIARFDKEGRHLYANPKVTELTGIAYENLIGKTNRELGMPTHLCAFWEKSIREVFARGEPSEIGFAVETVKGYRYFQSRLVPETGQDDSIHSVLAISRDVTEIRDAQTRLNGQLRILKMVTSGKRLLEILDGVATMVEERDSRLRAALFLMEEENNLHLAAAPSLQQTAETPVASLTAPLQIIHSSPKTPAGIMAQSTPDTKTNQAWDDYRHILAANGLIPCSSLPLYSSEQTLIGVLDTYWQGEAPQIPAPEEWVANAAQVAAIAIEKRQADEELERAEKALRDHNRELETRVAERTRQLRNNNQELENFCYSMAHDLRAPLRVIRSFSNILQETDNRRPSAEEEQDLKKRIHHAATNMDSLIENLLQYSRLSHQEVPVETVHLKPLLDRVLESLESDISDSEADITIIPPLPDVKANATILQQAAVNLVSNAIKYVPPGARPEIKIFCEEPDDTTVRLCLKDNGIGIPAEAKSRIFSAFERLHGSGAYSGTGLGLAIARRGIERMHGQIGVESQPGQGSLFWIKLRK